ncbi:MAG: hypothetical protein ABH863_03205 [Candidatus Micrarchaeota archaeon]
MNRFALVAAFILIAFPGLALAEFSSENAKSIALVYSNQDEAVAIPSDFAYLQYEGVTYWYAYFTPQDSTLRNLVLVIRQDGNEGTLETNKDVLRALVGVDYDLETLRILKERGIAFKDLKNVIDSLKFQLDNVDLPVIEGIKRQSEEDMTRVDDALFGVQTSADDAVTKLQEGMDYYENFQVTASTQDIIVSDLELVMDRYGEALDYVHAFVGKADDYQKAVSEKQREVTDASIAGELAKLGNLKVKDAVLKSYNASLAQNRREIADRELKKDRAISDTINSIFFRKARKDAQLAYDKVKNAKVIESLLSQQNEAVLKDCKLSTTDLKKRWDAIVSVMDPAIPRDASEYEKVPGKIAQAQDIANNLNSRLRSCLTATPKPTPGPEGPDYGGLAWPAAIIIIVVLAAYYLSGYLKRKPEEEQE